MLMHEPKITSDFGKIFHVIGTLLYNFHGQSISSFRGMQLITKNHIFPRSDADNSLLNDDSLQINCQIKC